MGHRSGVNIKDYKRQIADIEELLLLRNNFFEFFKQAWKVFEPSTPLALNWHHQVIAEHLQGLYENKIHRLLIALPPRFSKSSMVAVAFPAWVWVTKPSTRFLCASYALSLSLRDSQRCRELIDSPWYQARFSDSFEWTGDQNVKCLGGSTKIQTDQGELAIQAIVDGHLPVKVVSYNHNNGKQEYKSILAYEKYPGRSSLHITYANGASFTCTTNHPVYVVGKGYIQADKLQVGDTVYGKKKESNNTIGMRRVRKGIRKANILVSRRKTPVLQPALLLGMGEERPYYCSAKSRVACFDMRSMREAIREKEVTGWEYIAALLQPEMPEITGCKQRVGASVQVLWKSNTILKKNCGWTGKDVLQHAMSRSLEERKSCKQKDGKNMRSMWQTIYGISSPKSFEILLSRMLLGRASLENTWAGTSPIWQRVWNDVKGSAQARQRSVYALSQRTGTTRSTSHRSQQDEQCGEQSDNVVSRVPCARDKRYEELGELEETTIQDIVPVVSPSHVYNLEIADNHNYFANTILTHNSRYTTSYQGSRISTSVDSSATGEGGDYVICLSGDTRIQTDQGELAIQSIVEGRIQAKACSYNPSEDTVEYKPIVSYMKHPNTKKCLRVSLYGGEPFVDCTEDHRVYTEAKGYVPAKDLQVGDTVLYLQNPNTMCLQPAYVYGIKPIETLETVYNIEVQDNHNYIANSILLKNCDDPHNIQEGESDLIRNQTLAWWDRVMTSRLNDQTAGKMVVIGQRVNEDDLIGHLLETGDWEYLSLPAEYEESRKFTTSLGWEDPRTKDGEPLWQEKFPKSVLAYLKKTLGIHYYSQYQQSPVRDTGNIFKSTYFLNYSEYESYYVLYTPDGEKQVAKSACRTVISTDLALSEKAEADYTVFLTWAVTPHMEFLLTDIVHERMESPVAEEMLWGKAVSSRRFWATLIENVAFQKSVIQRLRRGTPVQAGKMRKGIPVIEFRPTTDKVARAQSIVVWFSSGNFYFNTNVAGYADFKKELLGFPRAGHDDFVDACSIIDVLFQWGEPRLTDYSEIEQLTLEEEAIQEISKSNAELASWLAEEDGVAYVPWWETV